MNATAVGGVLISLPRLYAFGCALALLLAGQWLLMLPRQQQTRWASGLVLSWVVGARLTYVLLHLATYRDAPYTLLMLWQPGYQPLGGLAATLLWTFKHLRHTFKPCLVALALVLVTHGIWYGLDRWRPFGQASGIASLPDLTLENLEGQPVHLSMFKGRLLLLNLWTSACPPCRHEMPLLAVIARRNDLAVVTVNQGESLLQVLRFLDDRRLHLSHVLLDPRQRLMAMSKTPGLPTTLLFDADGRLIDSHIGELTRAQWQQWQQSHDGLKRRDAFR